MMIVNFGTGAVATAVTILAPSLAMPWFSYLRPTIKPVMFCKNTSGMPRWAQSSMKCAPFRRLGKEDAVVGDDPDRIAVDVGKTRDQRVAVAGLEGVEPAAVHDAGDDLAHVVGLARVGRNHAVEFRAVVERVLRRGRLHGHRLLQVQVGD